MARPGHLAAIGLRIQYLQEAIRSSLLTSIYLIISPHLLHEEEINDFSKFYQHMVLGITEEARERGEIQKTFEELEQHIRDLKDVPDVVKTICLTLVDRMRPPPPLEI
jgi:hypothetical protein